VSGTFFVAALHEDAPDGLTFMAAMDTTTPQGRSWILFGNSIDPNDLSGANQLPTGNPATDANFGLRAVAMPVPEPGTAALLLAGLAALSRMPRPRRAGRS
jgi:PEP-CTERM motif